MSLQLPGGRMGKGIVNKFRMGMYTLLYLKWITTKDLLYNAWNSVQSYVAGWIGGGVEGENR